MNWLVIVIILVIILYVMYVYNRLVSLVNRTNEAWFDIDVQLKRRYDLIPNLVNLVKGYAKHENQVFEQTTRARTEALQAKSTSDKEAADVKVLSGMKQLFALAEDYPALKASENFAKLQDQLVDTEDTLASARKFYNGNVRELNIAIESFPQSLFAQLFHFPKRDFFEAESDAKGEIILKEK